jgi:hypothetical protein
MTSTTDKRPPPEGRASAKEEASENCLSLRHPAATRESHEQTSGRLWIGVTWIALIIEVQQNNARGRCVEHQRYATRTQDPDEAAAAYRAAATRCNIVARITPAGRTRGNGIALAYALIQRGIAVPLDPLEEWTARSSKLELEWADQTELLPERDIPWPLPAWRER